MVGEEKILKVCKELKTSVLFHILHRKGGLSPSYIFLINSSRLFTLPAIVYHLLNVSSSDAVAILCLTSCGIEYISPNRSRRISVRISVRPILRPSARPSSKTSFSTLLSKVLSFFFFVILCQYHPVHLRSILCQDICQYSSINASPDANLRCFIQRPALIHFPANLRNKICIV